MRVWLPLFYVIAASVAPWSSHAACGGPKVPYCQKLPDRTDDGTAIFLGTVKRVMAPVRMPASGTSSIRQSEDFPSARNKIGDSVSTAEKHYPIAIFDVVEEFVGMESAEVAVRLTSDVFVGSVPQQLPPIREGEVWLVEAYYDTHQQHWMTSMCQRTKLASIASQDLQALRAWKRGQRLPGWITGQLVNQGQAGKNSADVRVYLHGPKGTVSTKTDASGTFTFQNIEAGVYHASTDGSRSIRVDLTHSWCSFVVLFVDAPPSK
jgi:hypothetical protein